MPFASKYIYINSYTNVQMDDVGYSRETDHERKGQKNCCELAHNGIYDGSTKMPMALQTQRNGKVKIPKTNAWRMVPNSTAISETAADYTPCLHTHAQKAWFGTSRRENEGMDDCR